MRRLEQRVGVGRGEHHSVADQLDEPHRPVADLAGDHLEPAGHPAELLGRELLAELGEVDEVGEADSERPRVGRAHHDPVVARLVESRMAELLTQVQPVDVVERRPDRRDEAAGALLDAVGDLALGPTLADEGLADDLAGRGGELRHRHRDRPAQLGELVGVEAGIEGLADPVGGREVVGAHHDLVPPRHREAERSPLPFELLDRHA